VVYYSMNNLRGRLGSTRKTKRGRGCDAASSSFDPANASAMQAHFRPELTGSAPKTFGECGRYFAGRYSKTDERHIGRQRFGLSLRTVGATSWSGEGYGLLVVSAPDNTAPHYSRHHRNPYIEKGMHTRSQQLLLEAGSYRHEKCGALLIWGG
jgi:hypothetical protein